MPIVADYRMFRDHAITTEPGKSVVVKFRLPADAFLPAASGDGTAEQRPLIMSNVRGSADAENLGFRIEINEWFVVNGPAVAAETRLIYESVGGDRFNASSENLFKFKAQALNNSLPVQGSINFSDALLWFQPCVSHQAIVVSARDLAGMLNQTNA